MRSFLRVAGSVVVSALIDETVILLDKAEFALLKVFVLATKILLDEGVLYYFDRFHGEPLLAIESFDLVNTTHQPLILSRDTLVAGPSVLPSAHASPLFLLNDLWHIEVSNRLLLEVSLSVISI